MSDAFHTDNRVPTRAGLSARVTALEEERDWLKEQHGKMFATLLLNDHRNLTNDQATQLADWRKIIASFRTQFIVFCEEHYQRSPAPSPEGE